MSRMFRGIMATHESEEAHASPCSAAESVQGSWYGAAWSPPACTVRAVYTRLVAETHRLFEPPRLVRSLGAIERRSRSLGRPEELSSLGQVFSRGTGNRTPLGGAEHRRSEHGVTRCKIVQCPCFNTATPYSPLTRVAAERLFRRGHAEVGVA